MMHAGVACDVHEGRGQGDRRHEMAAVILAVASLGRPENDMARSGWV